MKRLTCEMCGSTDIMKENGVFVCQTCGTKYSVEEAKKMMVEIEGTVDVSGSTVKVDNSKELENLRVLARRARDSKNAKEAEKYYSQILTIVPNDWEAVFYTLYYQSLNIKIGEIGRAATTLKSSLVSLFKSVALIDNEHEKKLALLEVVSKIVDLCMNYRYNSLKHFKESFERMINTNETIAISYLEEHIETVKAILSVFMYLNDELAKYQDNDAFYDTIKNCILVNNAAYLEIFVNTPALIQEDQPQWRLLVLAMLAKINKYDKCYFLPTATFQGYPNKMVIISKKEVEKAGYNKMRTAVNENALKEKRENEQKEKDERIAKYWEEHAEEKQAFESRLSAIEEEKQPILKAIEEFDSKIEEVNTEKEKRLADVENKLTAAKDKIASLEKEKEKLGIFSGKQKKELQVQIDNMKERLPAFEEKVNNAINTITEEIVGKTVQIQKACKPHKDKLDALNEEETRIRTELEKDR